MAIALALMGTHPGCSPRVDRPSSDYVEHHKSGRLSLTILGDYFDPAFVLELAQVAKSLSPETRQVFFCTPQYETSLRRLFAANDVTNVAFRSLDAASPVLRQWARDVAVAGTRNGVTTLVVSPDKHAGSGAEAKVAADNLRAAFPECGVVLAPFVFEGGNLAFVESNGKRAVIVGRKVIHDNAVWQRRPWAPGYEGARLVDAIAETFHVDRVFVVGREETAPEPTMYFEYHIDMGMTILDGGRAVVSRLVYGDSARAELERAVRTGHPVVSKFAGAHADSLVAVLDRRLRTVGAEYEEYAALLDSLGLEVHRISVRWPHVLASMSWTNVVQAGNRIFMPAYPDSLHGVTTSVRAAGGRVRATVDVSGVGAETFPAEGENRAARRLYEDLGYDVVPVPEYLHYMMGGLHCFVNVLD